RKVLRASRRDDIHVAFQHFDYDVRLREEFQVRHIETAWQPEFTYRGSGNDEAPSILQEGYELRELLQLLLRQADLVRLAVLFLINLFTWFHYGTVNSPAPVDSGLSRLVQRHTAHRCHGCQVQRGVCLRYQPHHPFSNIVCKNRGRNRGMFR
ncbi:hypothetical protein ALC62_02738, partial [Cyphomyrmex costatus]